MSISPKVRKVVYIGSAALMAVMFGLGLVTGDQLNAALDAATRVVGIFASILALLNVSDSK